MTGYLQGRQNPVPERPIELGERDLAALVLAFGEPWLSRVGDHPLQRLWARPDSLATGQLLLLGGAVAELQPHFGPWVKDQIRAIKAGKAERRGAIFELLALHALRSGNAAATPTRRNFPGYDITVCAGGGTLDLSLKNFGMSEHEAAARREWGGVLKAYVAAREDALRPAIGTVVFASRYPTAEDWKQLVGAAQQLARMAWEGPVGQAQLGECWTFMLHPLPAYIGEYAIRPTSYQLVMVIPHHANEHANLVSYLEKAASNARKHARPGADVARALFIRFRESAALSQYSAWANDYLSENSEGPLDAVFMYQPTFAFTSADQHAMHHALVQIPAPKFINWLGGSPERKLDIVLEIGLTGGPVDRRIQVSGQRLDPGPSYVFQRGEYYVVFGNEGQVRLLAPGIHQHAIMHIGGMDPVILKGKYPIEDALDLFD